MLRSPDEAQQLVRRLVASGRYSEAGARTVIAATLGVESWRQALDLLGGGTPSYAPNWRDATWERYFDAHRPLNIDPLPFDVAFREPPRTTLDELRGIDVAEAVRLVASRHDPYGQFATDLNITGPVRAARHAASRTLHEGLVTSFEVARDQVEPGSRMSVFSWRMASRRSDAVVAAISGYGYAPVRNAKLDADEAVDVADEVSDRDVSNIRALFQAGLQVMERGIITIDELWVAPDERGRQLSHALLCLACAQLRSFRKSFAVLAIDPWMGADALVFPEGFESPGGKHFSMRHLCRALFERRYLQPLERRLTDMGFDAIRARTSVQLGFHQVLRLMGDISLGGDPLEEVESEEVAMEKIRAAHRFLADHPEY